MKNDKRNIAMEIIVLIVIFILLVIVRLNHNIWIGDYEYLLLNDKGTAQIVGYSGNGSVIYVPDNIDFEWFAQISGDEIFFGEGDYSDVSYTMSSTVVAPKESPLAKDCQENGINFRPITEEEDAARREKTEAAAADVVYQDE